MPNISHHPRQLGNVDDNKQQNMKTQKTLQPVTEYAIQFSEEELQELGWKTGDKISIRQTEDGILLSPFASIEIDLQEFDRNALIQLITRSVENDQTISETISNILEEIIESHDVLNDAVAPQAESSKESPDAIMEKMASVLTDYCDTCNEMLKEASREEPGLLLVGSPVNLERLRKAVEALDAYREYRNQK
jgi:bifunctional DNA-binding transcriptional regulator/antitoxin component of YhaV-PrlF toxin-antitoxin module